MSTPVPVIRVVRGKADDRECVAVLMAVLCCLGWPGAAVPAPPARARWGAGPRAGYRSPRSWRTP